MLSVDEVIENVDPFIINAPIKRVPERTQTLGSDVELETKVNIESINDIKNLIKKIADLGISKAGKRFEYHHFFAQDNDAHDVLILVRGSKEVWLKRKRDKKIILTPYLKLPLLLRSENKIKPHDEVYLNSFNEVFLKSYVGSIEKICIDLSFWFKNLSFTVTLSLACNISRNARLYQIEFEYDGHKENTKAPSFEIIILNFEEMLRKNFPSFLNRITTYTKLEWLKESKEKDR